MMSASRLIYTLYKDIYVDVYMTLARLRTAINGERIGKGR